MSVCLLRARCAARRGGRGLTSPFILYGTANGVLGDPQFVRSNGTCAVGVGVGSGAAWDRAGRTLSAKCAGKERVRSKVAVS
jgi:hypothetical protein